MAEKDKTPITKTIVKGGSSALLPYAAIGVGGYLLYKYIEDKDIGIGMPNFGNIGGAFESVSDISESITNTIEKTTETISKTVETVTDFVSENTLSSEERQEIEEETAGMLSGKPGGARSSQTWDAMQADWQKSEARRKKMEEGLGMEFTPTAYTLGGYDVSDPAYQKYDIPKAMEGLDQIPYTYGPGNVPIFKGQTEATTKKSGGGGGSKKGLYTPKILSGKKRESATKPGTLSGYPVESSSVSPAAMRGGGSKYTPKKSTPKSTPKKSTPKSKPKKKTHSYHERKASGGI